MIINLLIISWILPPPDEFYKDHKEQLCDLRDCIVREVQALAAAGCKYIQIDEPLLVRKPKIALEYGIDILAECFKV